MRKLFNWFTNRLQREEIESFVRVEYAKESRECQDYLIHRIRKTGAI